MLSTYNKFVDSSVLVYLYSQWAYVPCTGVIIPRLIFHVKSSLCDQFTHYALNNCD